jgi:hypothetical protein
MYTFIYALVDPRTDEIRYIGKSDNPKKRLIGHLKPSQLRFCNHKNAWIKSLLQINLKPNLVILEKVSAIEWKQKEQYYIQLYKNKGCNLTNSTDGGDGASGLIMPNSTKEQLRKALMGNQNALGHKVSLEAREKISSIHKGKLLSNETKKKISVRLTGQIFSLERRLNISKALCGKQNALGHKHTEESKLKMRLFRLGRKDSEETRLRKSQANTGRVMSNESKLKIGLAHRGKIVSTKTRCKESVSQANRKPKKVNTSGYLGIKFESKKNRWIARITFLGKRIYVGSYTTKEDAARARDRKALEFFGLNCYLNFPSEVMSDVV